ncbi:MAG: hypothetical protein NC397_09665 [Clostridium sp.]|nr:hypothetical protein [Clostridium sp.]
MDDWATPTLKECPWWRDDMTPEEYDIEREYYGTYFYDLVQKGKYVPLWKQKTTKHFAVDCKVLLLYLLLI